MFRFLVLILGIAVVRAQDWPQFLGPSRNGTYSGTNLSETWPKEGPPKLWQKDIGQGFSGPVVVSGRLIVFHRVQNKETVECLDAKSGKRLWVFDYATKYRDDFGFDEGPRATPCIANGQVYAYGAEGVLSCVALDTGKNLWSVDATKDFGARKGFFGIACSPTVEGELVLLNVGGTKGGVVAFKSADGTVAWKTGDIEASYSSPAPAEVNGQRYAFFFTREGLTTIEPTTGKIIFDFPWRPSIDASVNAATPLVIGDLIFISTSYGRGGACLRFGKLKPEVLWSGDDALSNHYATSVHHNGFLYGYHGRQEYGCDFRCVELKTGKVMWREERFGAGTVTLAGKDLLLMSERGELIKVPANPAGFKSTARAQVLGLQVRAYPALADGLFYARSPKQLVCVDLRKR